MYGFTIKFFTQVLDPNYLGNFPLNIDFFAGRNLSSDNLSPGIRFIVIMILGIN